MTRVPVRLESIFRKFDASVRIGRQRNRLRPVFGAGKFRRPRFLFCFINPTHLNLSSHPGYEGTRRYPFIGVRHVWRFFADAGFVDRKIVDDIYRRGWRIPDEDLVERSLAKHGVYLTNLVKCTQPGPENPTMKVVREDLPLLLEEIRIVDPDYIVTFGALPFRALAGQDIRLQDVFEAVGRKAFRPTKSVPAHGKTYPVLPCYFPIGRGDRKKALAVLRYIKKRFA